MENSLHDPSKDWFLSTLNNMVNSNNITIGITIITHGYIISGHLTGGRQYFEAVGNEFSSLLNSENVEDSLTGLANRIYNNESDNVKNGPLSSDYIHIQDAKFYKAEGSPIGADTMVWWRGRLSEVSGFSIGVVSGSNN